MNRNDYPYKENPLTPEEETLCDEIRSSAEDVNIPESLTPDAVRNRLELLSQTRAFSGSGRPGEAPDNQNRSRYQAKEEKPSFFRRNRRRISALGGLSAAALIALAFLWQQNNLTNEPIAPAQSSTETMEMAQTAAIATVQEAAEEEAFTQTEQSVEKQIPEDLPLQAASSYEALYQTLYEKFGSAGSPQTEAGLATMEMAADTLEDSASSNGYEGEAAYESAAVDTGATADYSSTNVQEEGVDEGDVIKTDGKYLYIMKSSGKVHLIALDGTVMKAASVITLPNPNETLREMYLDGDTLLLVASGHTTTLDTSDKENKIYSMRSEDQTTLYTYDIADRSSPQLKGSVTQSGYYQTSRKTGSYIYLITQYSPYLASTWEDSRISPLVNGTAMEADQIFLPESLNHSPYLVISSVNTENPDKTVDQVSIVSAASNFYVSTENIYIANESWGTASHTDLIRVNYADGIITPCAAGSVNGYLNNSFSMNEYQGYLRLVATSYDSDSQKELNSLYILDAELKVTGSIKDLAPGELIRSARFFGDTAYFVTFRQTDPLFSADLSDPQNPVILNELKVTGFSSYLHIYGENLLLGLGYEADEETGITTGLKLSMFDTADPSAVTEADRLVIKDITWCDGLNDYKSILADAEKNLIGFSCNGSYLLFTYDENQGFTNLLTADLNADETWSFVTRGAYAGDTFYVITGSSVKAYEISNNYRYASEIKLE